MQDYERRYFREDMTESITNRSIILSSSSHHLSSFSSALSLPTPGIIRPITLCLNIYRAALGKHEPSLCMGAQHVGSPSLSRNQPHRRHCRCTHGLPLSLSLCFILCPLRLRPRPRSPRCTRYQHTDIGDTYTRRTPTANRKLNSRQRAHRACSQLRGAPN